MCNYCDNADKMRISSCTVTTKYAAAIVKYQMPSMDAVYCPRCGRRLANKAVTNKEAESI